jgi:integrase
VVPAIQQDLSECQPTRLLHTCAEDPKHKKGRQAARDIFILMIDAGFRINEASALKWSDIDFDNGVIYLYRSKVSDDDFTRSLPCQQGSKLSLDQDSSSQQ